MSSQVVEPGDGYAFANGGVRPVHSQWCLDNATASLEAFIVHQTGP